MRGHRLSAAQHSLPVRRGFFRSGTDPRGARASGGKAPDVPGGGNHPPKRETYAKRALWGWDRDNFAEGHDPGVFEADSLRIGIRICYEVRFPEYFRELYKQKTDLNIVLFYDVSRREYPDRLDLIRAHIRTRAVENVCPTLTCNTCSGFQTAPTVYYDRSGKLLAEAAPGKEELMFCDFEQHPLGFGEQGRKEISDSLTGGPEL